MGGKAWWYRCCLTSWQHWSIGIPKLSFRGHRLSWPHRQSTATCHDMGQRGRSNQERRGNSQHPFSYLPCVSLWPPAWSKSCWTQARGMHQEQAECWLQVVLLLSVERREKERERTCLWKPGMPATILFSPVSGCQFLFYFFLSHLMPAAGSFFICLNFFFFLFGGY